MTLALGLDFGTESVRALLVDVQTGEELASAVAPYSHGVIDERLPNTDIRLPSEWALQDADDYKSSTRNAVRQALELANASSGDIIGVGIDFTACTLVPSTHDGIALSAIPEHRNNPHAWTKLWKHHAAQPEATEITKLALARDEQWLKRCGGKVSSEWLHSKALQVLHEAPEMYHATDCYIEAGDWFVWQLTGVLQRNACAAGYKASWSKTTGYPSAEFLAKLDPRFGTLADKLQGDVKPPGTLAGVITEEAAAWSGLRSGTPVAMATIDAHAAVPGAGITEEGTLLMVLGTSTCHMLLGKSEQLIPGIAGIVEDGILPGFFGYEAGQAGVGDSFEWFVEQCVPASYTARAASLNLNLFELLEREASQLRPGESGLLALDWWNGNRSVLCDAELSGAIFGLTLGSRPHHIYRALIEATAYGTKVIIDQFESGGVPIKQIVACGGLAVNNRLLLQIYADVTGRTIHLAHSDLTSALGAAMFGAVAAGVGTLDDISAKFTKKPRAVIEPIAAHRDTYAALFDTYRELHDTFGLGGIGTLKKLRALRG